LNNLVFTDCLDFIFYKDGEKYKRVQIAKIEDKNLVFLEENFSKLENLEGYFMSQKG